VGTSEDFGKNYDSDNAKVILCALAEFCVRAVFQMTLISNELQTCFGARLNIFVYNLNVLDVPVQLFNKLSWPTELRTIGGHTVQIKMHSKYVQKIDLTEIALLAAA
jgi:hypothetical protein